MKNKKIIVETYILGFKVKVPLSSYIASDGTLRVYSSASTVSSVLKQILTQKGWTVKARSQTFSMGDSVDIDIIDIPNALEERKMIKKYVSFLEHKFRSGKFDGMTDCYDYEGRDSKVFVTYEGQKIQLDTKYLCFNFSRSDPLTYILELNEEGDRDNNFIGYSMRSRRRSFFFPVKNGVYEMLVIHFSEESNYCNISDFQLANEIKEKILTSTKG